MANADNMKLWNQVEKTDPNDTKKVNQRGGFTAIDANSQFRKATEAFGPIGEGWGAEIIEVWFTQNNMVAIQIDFWQTMREYKFPAFGCCKLGSADRPDEDAFKKALTDAETKALSQLGFNHDVFQGKFDDNKYVTSRMKEEAEEKQWTGPLKKSELKVKMRSICVAIDSLGPKDTIEYMRGIIADDEEIVKQARVDLPEFYNSLIEAKDKAKKRMNEFPGDT